jgi:signal transduction histidine kinase
MYSTHTIVISGMGALFVNGDKDRLEQVFINLLSNAINYSPAASSVELTCESFPEFIAISIRDHGVGIAREEQEKIFERFYRALDLGQRTVSGLGLGLGLYMAEEIVKQHGGAITVESKVGEGSTFRVKLPRHVD